MLLYLIFPLLLLSCIAAKIVYTMTKNYGLAQAFLFKVFFAFQWLLLGCGFTINQHAILKKKIFMICNHPSYFDALPIFWWALKNGRMQDFIFVAKDSISKAPLVGDIIKDRYLLIKRNFDTDSQTIINFCNQLNSSNKPYIFLIFPEGTTYSKTTIEKSNNYATEHKIVPFKNVLCPRVLGTDLILKYLKPDCVLDMTITYDDYADHYGTKNGIPFSSSNGLLKSQYPKSTIIDVHDISSEILSENNNVPDIVMSRWRLKDTLIQNNITKNGYNSSTDKMIHMLIIVCIIKQLFF